MCGQVRSEDPMLKDFAIEKRIDRVQTMEVSCEKDAVNAGERKLKDMNKSLQLMYNLAVSRGTRSKSNGFRKVTGDIVDGP